MTRAKDPLLQLQAAPLLKQTMTVPLVMRDVLYALMPATLAGFWYFGLGALLIVLTSIAGAVLTEWVFSPQDSRRARLLDGSGVLTGLLLGLTLPPGLPLWMAFVGAAVAIGLGKLIWGGLGHNRFNPALVGRAFLLASFPAAMTSWNLQSGPAGFFDVPTSVLALPLMQADYDALSAATPLGLMKFEYQATPLWDLVLGKTSGCIGETSGLLLLLGGAYLLLRRALDWRIPTAVLLSVLVFSRPSMWPMPRHTPALCSRSSPAVCCSAPSTWPVTR